MTVAPSPVTPRALSAEDLPALRGGTLSERQLRAFVRKVATTPELWREHLPQADEASGARHYASLYRDADVDLWLLCWNLVDDTGWHDHDTSSGAVSVVHGAVNESRPRLGGTPARRTVSAGSTFSFGPDHIHRMGGAVDGAVSIHAYSPPLWRMGQYSISASGVMRRWSVSYADELRPLDDVG